MNSLIEKIRNFFNSLFSKNKKLELPKENENQMNSNDSDNKLDYLKVNIDTQTMDLKSLIENDKSKVTELTSEQLDDLIKAYTDEINSLEQKLTQKLSILKAKSN